MINTENFFLPDSVRELPEGSLQKSLARLMIKNSWHNLFDFAPSLLPLAAEIFEPFLKFAEEQSLSMKWSLHIHCLNWLKQRRPVDDKIIKELLIAAATRWSLEGMDHIAAKNMLIASQHIPGFAVGIRKSTHAAESGQIIILKIPPVAEGYTLSAIAQWDISLWQPLPL